MQVKDREIGLGNRCIYSTVLNETLFQKESREYTLPWYPYPHLLPQVPKDQWSVFLDPSIFPFLPPIGGPWLLELLHSFLVCWSHLEVTQESVVFASGFDPEESSSP